MCVYIHTKTQIYLQSAYNMYSMPVATILSKTTKSIELSLFGIASAFMHCSVVHFFRCIKCYVVLQIYQDEESPEVQRLHTTISILDGHSHLSFSPLKQKDFGVSLHPLVAKKSVFGPKLLIIHLIVQSRCPLAPYKLPTINYNQLHKPYTKTKRIPTIIYDKDVELARVLNNKCAQAGQC